MTRTQNTFLAGVIHTTGNPMENLEYGYSVIIAARWMLVAVALCFVLYRPQSVAEITVGTMSVLGIAALNFWLHTRPLTNRPVEAGWAYLASLADLAVISGLMLWQGSASGQAYVFYYPAIVAYSLVFPAEITFLLTSGMLAFVLKSGVDEGLDARVLVARLLTLLATAVIGWRYRKVEERRRAHREKAGFAVGVYASESSRIEEQEDIFHGQIVCITARWCLIGGAIFLTLFRADNIAAMERALVPLLALVAANFFLQARYMMKLPANGMLLRLGSLVDLGVATAVIAAGNREFFVFYYPVILAYGLVFARRATLVYTAVLALVYTGVIVLTGHRLQLNGDEEALAMRLVTLLGTTLLGTMYWRLQRARRPVEA